MIQAMIRCGCLDAYAKYNEILTIPCNDNGGFAGLSAIFAPSRENSYDKVQRDSQAKGGTNFGRIANRLLPPWQERGVFIFRKSAPSKRGLGIQAIFRKRTHDQRRAIQSRP